MAGKLYLVPTPIGNLEDITYRAVRILNEVDIIAAEDTRHTGILLKQLDIQTPMISYHEHNKEEKGAYLIHCLLEGKSIAQVSDAGMPAISDPGADLVKKAIAADIEIIPLPGPNAGLTALIASGLDTVEFTFVGFLPKRSNHRKEELQRLKSYAGTLIFYEAPHRLKAVLPDMLAYLGNRPICIGRELTKKFETFTRLTLQELLDDLEQITFKGEFVLLVGGVQTGSSMGEPMMANLVAEDPVALVNRLQAEGAAKKEAIREVAKQFGMARRDVYNLVEKNNL